jgi:hypothetical protein
MKSIAKTLAALGILVFAGGILVWKTQGQSKFGDEVRQFVEAGITKLEICSQMGSNAVNCNSVEHETTFHLIASALATSAQKMPPGHGIASFERVIKLHRQDILLCLRAVEFQQSPGAIYLESVVPDQSCATFKYGPHALLANGLSKALLDAGPGGQPPKHR